MEDGASKVKELNLAPSCWIPAPESQGLDAAEARRRLREFGPNRLTRDGGHGLARLLLRVLTEPMFLLLIGAVLLYFILGDAREALVLAGSMLLIAAITVLQERRTDRALRALRDLSAPRAAVIRDGALQRIAGYEVVPGDIVVLAEGDRVPADGSVRRATDLSVDESLLTGESQPVSKTVMPVIATMVRPHEAAAGGCVYGGTLVVRGHATIEVLATGAHTEFGGIGHAVGALSPDSTPLYTEILGLIRWVAAAGLGLCVLIMVLYALLRGDWLQGALAGITLAMTVLPEEFPVVLTVFMAIGAWRLSKLGVLTRRLPAIEALGSATVLALDKTGTLTENRMAVALLDSGTGPVWLDGQGTTAMDPASTALLAIAHAACELEVFDPMERAIKEAAARHAAAAIAWTEAATLLHEYDLAPDLPAVTHVWRESGARPLRVAMKGAPEAVIALCHLGAARTAALLSKVDELAGDGLRVLAIASGTWAADTPLPAKPREFLLEFRGLLALRDPVRSSVPAAIAACRQAGIRIVMITGDHAHTARAVARAVGLDTRRVLTSAELADADDTKLAAMVEGVDVFARTTPELKLRLVRALRDRGEVVAMIGDGVNDAPALSAAHIGVAMGMRGTDVAREAAGLVLLKDDLGSLAAAIGAGRGIYANVRMAMTYLLAVHLPLAGIGLAPLLFGWPLLLFPLHVAFLEFIIDPACSLVFENEHSGKAMLQQPPRAPTARMLSRSMLLESLAMGSTSLVSVTLVYGIALQAMPETQARALGFVALVVSNLALILVARTRAVGLFAALLKRNAAFWLVNVLSVAALAVVLGVPAIAAAFRFERPATSALLLAITAAAGSVGLVAVLRRLKVPGLTF